MTVYNSKFTVFANGVTLANAALIQAGSGGAITVVAGKPTELIIDVNGYFAP